MPFDEKPTSLQAKVASWLKTEGYPLEFRAAHVFRRHGFEVLQGDYVEDLEAKRAREVDLSASVTLEDEGDDSRWMRVEYIVECKSSMDKPWVLFTSDQGLAPSACVAQTIGSRSGQGIVRARANERPLHQLDTFVAPERPAFGGRQAFGKGNDVFYDAVQGVVSKAVAKARQFDRGKVSIKEYLEAALLILPVVVVDGKIFRAFYDFDLEELSVEPISRMRLHWRGADAWRLHATVDIVASEALDEFVGIRAKEAPRILELMLQTVKQIEGAAADTPPGTVSVLRHTPSPETVPSHLQRLYAKLS